MHPSESAIAAIRSALGFPVEVRFPAGAITVEADPYLERLPGSSSDEFRRAALHITALESAVRAASAASPVDERRLHAALVRALAGVGTAPSLGKRVGEAIVHVLRWLVSRLAHVRGAGSILSWLIVFGILAGLLVLIRTLGLGVVPDHRVGGPSVVESKRGAAEWRALAEEALSVGDRAGAVRCLYHAISASLDARGIVAATPSLTAGEFRAATRASLPLLADSVDEATQVFERAVYGLWDPDDDEVQLVAAAERTVRIS